MPKRAHAASSDEAQECGVALRSHPPSPPFVGCGRRAAAEERLDPARALADDGLARARALEVQRAVRGALHLRHLPRT